MIASSPHPNYGDYSRHNGAKFGHAERVRGPVQTLVIYRRRVHFNYSVRVQLAPRVRRLLGRQKRM